LHYYVGDLNIANRMLRQAEAASEAYDIKLVYRSEREDEDHWANGRFQTIFMPKSKQTPSTAASWRIPQFLFREIYLFLRLLRLDADLFHPHQHSSMLVTCMWLLLTGKPVVFDPHDMHIHNRNKRGISVILKRWLEKFIANRASALLVVSEGMRDLYKRKYAGRLVYLLPNLPAHLDKGISSIKPCEGDTQQRSEPARSIRLVYAGLIKPERLSLEVIEIVGTIGKQVRLDIFGFSPNRYDEVVRNYIQKNGFTNIKLRGRYSETDIVSDLREYDYFILPFRIQNDNIRYCMPNKVYQALAAGLPIIASNMVEVGHLVQSNEIGYIFEDGDYAAFAEILKQLEISGQEFVDQRRRVQKVSQKMLDYKAYQSKLLGVYDAALSSREGKQANVIRSRGKVK
jgi:glycosyltransferase involved in cell wall biosynthesis